MSWFKLKAGPCYMSGIRNCVNAILHSQGQFTILVNLHCMSHPRIKVAVSSVCKTNKYLGLLSLLVQSLVERKSRKYIQTLPMGCTAQTNQM